MNYGNHDKMNCSSFMSSDNFFHNLFLHISKCLKIHQLNIIEMIKKDYKKKLVKDKKVFLKKKKKRSNNMVMDDTKICQKMKKKA